MQIPTTNFSTAQIIEYLRAVHTMTNDSKTLTYVDQAIARQNKLDFKLWQAGKPEPRE